MWKTIRAVSLIRRLELTTGGSGAGVRVDWYRRLVFVVDIFSPVVSH